jgi:hypothetical protein
VLPQAPRDGAPKPALGTFRSRHGGPSCPRAPQVQPMAGAAAPPVPHTLPRAAPPFLQTLSRAESSPVRGPAVFSVSLNRPPPGAPEPGGATRHEERARRRGAGGLLLITRHITPRTPLRKGFWWEAFLPWWERIPPVSWWEPIPLLSGQNEEARRERHLPRAVADVCVSTLRQGASRCCRQSKYTGMVSLLV